MGMWGYIRSNTVSAPLNWCMATLGSNDGAHLSTLNLDDVEERNDGIPSPHLLNYFDKIRLIQSGPQISQWEALATSADIPILDRVYSYLDPVSLFALGQTSTRMYGSVRHYEARVWSLRNFLSTYIRDASVNAFRDLLRNCNALAFGPAVLTFFDRTNTGGIALDIAVPYEAMLRFAYFLYMQGYTVQGGLELFKHMLNDHASCYSAFKLKVRGERNIFENDRESERYTFERHCGHCYEHNCVMRSVVVLHLVRCLPHQHVLFQHSCKWLHVFIFPYLSELYTAALMNVISCDGAVSLFPRTTFVHRRSLVCRIQQLDSDNNHKSGRNWLQKYAKFNDMYIVGLTFYVFERVEIGPRKFGDDLCWFISYDHDGM